jgi:hypothetical protein
MTKAEALTLIANHKNKPINPVEMLHWIWLKVIINQIPDSDWERYLVAAYAHLILST